MIADIKEALYVAETARRNGPDSLTKEQLSDALVSLAQAYEELGDRVEETEEELFAMGGECQ